MPSNSANALHGETFVARVGAAMSEFFAAVAQARRMADRYETYSHLNNSEAERMGLSQQDIPQSILRPHH